MALKEFPGTKNRIGRRLIIYTIAFSSAITLVLSAIQLVLEYRELRDDLDQELEQVAIYVPNISGSVWAFDDKQIGLAVEALASLPHVDRAAIAAAEGDKRWAAGKPASPHAVTRNYSLRHDVRGADAEIGSLTVTASLDGIYRRVATHAVSIVLSNGLKTFLVAIFMFAIFRRQVTRRLESLASDVHKLAPQLQFSEATDDDGPPTIPDRLDEVDALRWALESTGRKLGLAVGELRRLNEELETRVRERTMELESANRELNAFGYTLSHDLRAPLRVIEGFSRILQEDYADRLDRSGQDHLAHISHAAQRMNGLIDDTLGLFKVSAGPLNRRPVALGKIARQVADQLSSAEPERDVEWLIDEAVVAEGDPGLLRTVMENLIGNAWKYSSKRDRARIEVGALPDETGTASYFVRDNGVGFDIRQADRLFRPFQRLHGETEFPGTGIGLATVAKIVQRHGGKVWADASPDQGATFHFTLRP